MSIGTIMMTIGIIVAMDGEYEQMLQLLGGKNEGTIGPNKVVVLKSGIGKVNAALQAQNFIKEYSVDCLVSTGVAGGLSHELKCMDVLAASEVVYHDVWCGEGNAYGQVQGYPARFEANNTLLNCAKQIGATTGLIASGDFFINTNSEAQAILAHFPEALGVDMESGAIAQTCHKYGVPFLSIRIISDVAGENHQSEYDNFWKYIADRSFHQIEAFLSNLPSHL